MGIFMFCHCIYVEDLILAQEDHYILDVKRKKKSERPSKDQWHWGRRNLFGFRIYVWIKGDRVHGNEKSTVMTLIYRKAD